ncbi:bifunctional [glutamate--ammonia ligase]-adenylyl-L-tyrosine phosphorylase/[glutamate--ammonia-ligase] adenylyltransferase [Rheinheimera sp. YQF-2]|uniref:Bifunctional glutamine synthetase adenylyltransferase/adenylyl-removing enzyme n=1 Tax=Rheinheimera lutimaris TaxID=2740584 RepID=A0A7Y5ATE7_9GAMM|nr:bifunctional [glutamate--ammonia ligase]-adenylyl-L-tyrosine phosphorylase/[glutamate--ammonia-ligase] adenylyltransferase [Rheinheimera lutimaris]NRQ44227.1 bifunctional [glutamate--ammonia ligase]-adenylyl-L-tyrosine phosphorylase/[glutamate--ammonia-ligase] adenylyltransferase [Rheinheimera lutimaris]
MTQNNAALNDYLAQILSRFELSSLSSKQLQQLQRLLSASSFIGRTLQQQPRLLAEFCDPATLQQQLATPGPVLAADTAPTDEAAVFAALRRYRNAQLCRILAADILQLQQIEASLQQVSQLADVLINTAYHWAYQQLSVQWGTPLDDQGKPMPLLILGMGKLGGGELNFSSDIDLIFTYPANGDTSGGRRSTEHQQFFTKLGQKLIAALHQVTADGFAYRVDMRLRPFGDSGPLVLSFAAMEDYYQEQGREWERYAMLKARVLNPDGRHSAELQQLLKPFIYRRYIDFSAIESLRRMKQQIEQENRRLNRRDNIKLGVGGIREVEFIVQTLQLIRGGRIPAMQQPSLLKALPVLAHEAVLTPEQADELRSDYLLLRRVEQALQGIDDQQTQTLPQDELPRAQLLAALQLDSWATLQHQVDGAMARVHQQFKLVIDNGEEPEQQDTSVGKLLWDSEQPAEDLAPQLDWLDVPDAMALIAQLHEFKQDCQKRSVGPRGRDFLAKLVPLLLHMLQQQQSQPTVLARVLGVFRHIVTRTAYLELLFENTAALQQLVLLCNQSGWLAEQLARYPMLLDELIDPAQLYQVASRTDYSDRLRQHMLRVPADDLELQMETLRQYKQAQQLRIAAADISGVLPLMKVSDHLTWLAEEVMAQVVELAWQQMAERYGVPANASAEDKGFAVIAYGKLGGLELGYGSDLDLVFVHNCDSQQATNGERSIDSKQFYLKLVQRVLHLCTTRTNSGVLYDIDTRLRPSGNSGLLAIHINTYGEYLQQEAWTWEHQALVRARLIYGSAALQQQFEQIRQRILSQPRDLTSLKADVVQMREKLRQHHAADAADPKHSSGGIVDLEFISQYLVLAHAATDSSLYRYSDNIRILDAAAAAGLLSTEQVVQLQQAYQLLRGAGHRQTLAPATLPSLDSLQQARQQVEHVWQQLFYPL